MSVDFARRYMAEIRAYGVEVIEHPGWETRGNGQTSAYLGGIIHHTAAGFDAGLSILINGRADLPGPLCNVAGHAGGAVRLVAAHPANHAGAGAGKSMGPLPRTSLFNRLVWGLEIMYPGTVPMTREQRRTALIHAGVVSKLLGRPNPEWVRAHAETSATGKWDPGFEPGKTIDMAQFRADVMPALIAATAPAPPPEEDFDMDRNEAKQVFKEALIEHARLAMDGRVDVTPARRADVGYARDQLIAAITKLAGAGPDLTEQQIVDALTQGAAQAIRDQVLPVLEDVVAQALGQDNEALAAEIVQLAGERLRAVA